MSSKIVAVDPIREMTEKIQGRQARVGIIGMGYVGLPLALLFSEQTFPVTGFDVDDRKVGILTGGGSYIVRIPAAEVQQARGRGFDATSDYSRLEAMDAVIICVPTPLNEYHEPDLSFVTNTAAAIAPHLRAGQLIVLESTTYPGTTEEVVVPILEKNRLGLKAARNGDSGEGLFYVAFSPEREDPGRTDIARHDIPKVVGGLDKRGSELGAALYGSIFRRTVQVSSPAAAEMTKLLENIYRCVNIAMVNELKMFACAWGLTSGKSSKPRRPSPSASRRSTPALVWAGTVFRWIPSISPGRPSSSIFELDSSSWLARSTPPCPIM